MNLKKALFLTAAVVSCCVISNCQTVKPTAGSPPAAVNYFGGAKGILTIDNPPSIVNDRVPLTGSTTLPELVIHVQKKGSPEKGAQAVYRTAGKPDFRFSYLIKNGPGVYDFILYGRKHPFAGTLTGLCSFSVRSEAVALKRLSGPDISGKIIAYVESVIGKTVGTGECWDLAKEALDATGADWAPPLGFGALLDPEKDAVKPGDIIQFRSVRLVAKLPGGGTLYQTIGVPDHTAIVTAVEGKYRYTIAQQNSDGKRYVIISPLDLNLIRSGSFKIYRPVAGIVQ